MTRIRRVRCDEGKPACNRCVSTGRKCDGYETPAESSDSNTLPIRSSSSPDDTGASPSSLPPLASSDSAAVVSRHRHNHNQYHDLGLPNEYDQRRHPAPQATAELKLALSRTDPQELRSYRYFLEVTAPCISGCFDMKFWLEDIPRVCLTDPAIWHAIISLGSVHEHYQRTGGGSSLARNVFALRQFNASIRCLTESNSPRRLDRMRALTVSAIFTCVCVLDGRYAEARMHANSGVNLLGEIEEDQRQKRSLLALKKLMGPQKPQDLSKVDQEDAEYAKDVSPWDIPISTNSVRSIIHSYEVAEKTFASGGFDELPPLAADNERFGIWSTYRLPSTSPEGQSPLTLKNLTMANRAAESAIHGLGMWAHEHGPGLAELCVNPSVKLMLDLLSDQKQYIGVFRLIQRAVRIFEREFAAGNGAARGASELDKLVLERSLLALRTYNATINFVLIGDPDDEDIIARYMSLPGLCRDIVQMTEKIISIEAKLKAERVSMPPIPGLATPLFTVGFGGFGWTARYRAVELLRVPRLDGLWDSLMAAGLAQASMEREKEARDVAISQGKTAIMRAAAPEEEEPETATLYRVYKMYAQFTGKRELVLRLRTWGEVINGDYGQVSVLNW